jgi:hypothetical protein
MSNARKKEFVNNLEMLLRHSYYLIARYPFQGSPNKNQQLLETHAEYDNAEEAALILRPFFLANMPITNSESYRSGKTTDYYVTAQGTARVCDKVSDFTVRYQTHAADETFQEQNANRPINLAEGDTLGLYVFVQIPILHTGKSYRVVQTPFHMMEDKVDSAGLIRQIDRTCLNAVAEGRYQVQEAWIEDSHKQLLFYDDCQGFREFGDSLRPTMDRQILQEHASYSWQPTPVKNRIVSDKVQVLRH